MICGMNNYFIIHRGGQKITGFINEINTLSVNSVSEIKTLTCFQRAGNSIDWNRLPLFFLKTRDHEELIVDVNQIRE
jgi:hypothetical protein